MNFKAKYIFKGLLTAVLTVVFGVYIGILIPWGVEFLEYFYYIILATSFVCIVVFTLWDCEDRDQEDYEGLLKKKFLPVSLPGSLIFWTILAIVGYFVTNHGLKVSSIYNQSVVYNKQYQRATEGLMGFEDATWKTYKDKKELAGVSRESFMELARIAFDARKDGASVAWKWANENTKLPYNEVLILYNDLSSYIQSRRDQYYALEVNRQNIAAAHNMLIDTFPNNIYNKILGRKPIIFHYGFLSDSTNLVFKKGLENPK